MSGKKIAIGTGALAAAGIGALIGITWVVKKIGRAFLKGMGW